MALLASLPFNMFYSHLILASYAIHTLIHLDKRSIKPLLNWRTLALQSVFIVTVLSTVYAVNKHDAFDEWGKRITVFIFPVIFCLNPLDIKKYRPQLLMAFALVCTATVVYLYIDALIVVRHYKLPFSKLFSPAFTNHNFSEPIDMHATFFSIQVVVALIYLLSVLTNELSFYKKLFYSLCFAVLAAGLIQLSSKSILVVLIIVINAALPFFLLKEKRRLRFMLVSASLTILAGIVILNSGTLKERYIAELRLDLTKSPPGATTDSRWSRWDAASELIAKSPVIGYGAGSEIGLLQTTYFDHKLFNSYLNRLNAHSEYLSFLIKSGVIGLLVYVASLAFGFNIAIRQKDLLFLTFMMLIAIVSLSENLLDVHKGTFFYAFFFTFFIFSNEKPAVDKVLSRKPEALAQVLEV
jgi:O-antigen ligase